MTVRQKKAEKKKLYSLGWFEDDNYVWRCSKCDEPKQVVYCPGCGRCEWCAPSPCRGSSG